MLTLTSNAKAARHLAGMVLCLLLFSFAPAPGGGEGFEIFLNNRVVLQEYGSQSKVVKTLKLDQSNENDELAIRYHHCGRVGKNRVITIKDQHDRVLRQWKFTDVNSVAAKMSCKVKDILNLKKGRDNTIKLYYSSSELPAGRQLASIVTGTRSVASL